MTDEKAISVIVDAALQRCGQWTIDRRGRIRCVDEYGASKDLLHGATGEMEVERAAKALGIKKNQAWRILHAAELSTPPPQFHRLWIRRRLVEQMGLLEVVRVMPSAVMRYLASGGALESPEIQSEKSA